MGTKFSEWAEEQKANETPAQAELRRRFGAGFALGLQFTQARQARGLTQRQLSEITGVAPADISRIERGTGNPTEATLHRQSDRGDAAASSRSAGPQAGGWWTPPNPQAHPCMPSCRRASYEGANVVRPSASRAFHASTAAVSSASSSSLGEAACSQSSSAIKFCARGLPPSGGSGIASPGSSFRVMQTVRVY